MSRPKTAAERIGTRLVTLALAILLLLVLGQSAVAGEIPDPEVLRATVLLVEDVDEDPVHNLVHQRVRLLITAGSLAGETVTIDHHRSGNPAYDLHLRVGDRVLVGLEIVDSEQDLYVMDFSRDAPMVLMATLFVVALVVVGGFKGFKATVVLVLTGMAVALILVPQVLAGKDPVMVTTAVSAGVVTIGLAIIAGLNRKALAASVGTVFGLLIAGLLAALFGRLTYLTGFGTHEAQMLAFVPGQELDLRGLLFAGMILGALGAVMDVAMSISSAVEEVRKAKPLATFKELLTSGTNVGRDVLGTMANTLILAYAGGALPLLLLLFAYQMDLASAANLELIAAEVVRALSGSTGLVVAVPVTALVAAWLYSRGR